MQKKGAAWGSYIFKKSRKGPVQRIARRLAQYPAYAAALPCRSVQPVTEYPAPCGLVRIICQFLTPGQMAVHLFDHPRQFENRQFVLCAHAVALRLPDR